MWISFCLSLIVLTHFLLLESTVKVETEPFFRGEIINIEKSDKYQKLTVKNGTVRYLLYDYDFLDLSLGDVVSGTGLVMKADPPRIEGGFDYRAYLKHKRIVKSVRCEELRVIYHKFTFRKLKSYFLSYLENNFEKKESLIFLKAMLIGDDDSFSEELQEAVVKTGILHLFAVSGLHIIIFVEIINKFLQFFKLRENIIIVGICTFLFFYLIITGFSPSVLRAALMYYLAVVNKKLKLGFSSLDIISFCFLLMITINPYYMYDYGFILSFLASLVIILFSPLISHKGHFFQILSISFIVTLITLPFTVNLNNDINLLSPLTNVLFIDLVEGIVLPFSLLVFALPILGRVYQYLVISFEKITVLFGKKLYLPLRFPDFNFLSSEVYYCLLLALFLFYQRKTYRRFLIGLNLLFIFLYTNQNFLKTEGEINFLDLYNGEAILIQTPLNECTALIDTGDGSNNDLVDFLKSKGINSLDYLFLTHNHYDHNGGTSGIIKNFSVKKIVLSAYDDSEIASFPEILRVKAGDRVDCGNVSFLILHPDCKYEDENDNSIVIYARFGNYNFLFMGDAGRKIEEKLLVSNLQVDVIKIAHHGSNTSTSPSFISKLHPKYAIIQTGRIEKFGFPHAETIATLESNGVIVYRTDLHYSIKYRFRKNGSIFETIKENNNLVH